MTDAEGLFEFHGIARDPRPVYVLASHDDYPEIPARIELGRGTVQREVEVKLYRPDTLIGRVIDIEGNPVAGAAVTLETGRLQQIYLRRQTAAGLRRTVSRTDGSFSIRVPHGLRKTQSSAPSTLAARHARHGVGRSAPLVGPPAGESWPEMDIVLAMPSSASGRVVGPDGAPVAGARVRATRMELVRDVERETAITATTFSGADGAYRLGHLEPGTYTLEVRALGFAPLVGQSLEVTEQPITHDVALEAGFRLDGHVIDAAGRPVEGAEVHAFSAQESDTDPRHIQTRNRRERYVGVLFARSDREGRWSLTNLPYEETILVARAAKYRPSDLQTVEPGGVAPDLVIEPYATLSGTSTDAATGGPVGGFQIYLRRAADERSRHEGRPDIYLSRDFAAPHGEFFIDGLPGGRYVVGISAPGYAVDLAEATLRPGEETQVRFELRRGRRLLATVRDIDSGRPVSDVSVNVHQRGRDSWERRLDSVVSPYRGVSDANGSIVLEGLVSGKYRAYANHLEYKLSAPKLEIEITDADPTEIALEIGVKRRTGGKLEGTIDNVRDRGSIDHRIALVSLDEETTKPLEAYIEFSGEFELRGIPPGDYEVHFREKFPTEKGEKDRKRTGSMAIKDTVQKSTVLGHVRIVDGETATFDHAFERDGE